MTAPDWPLPRGARLRLRLAWVAIRMRRGRRRVTAVLATAACLACLAVLVTAAPAHACRLHAIATPGVKAHYACATAATP